MKRRQMRPLTPRQQKIAADNRACVYKALMFYGRMSQDDADEAFADWACHLLMRCAKAFRASRGRISTLIYRAVWSELRRRQREFARRAARERPMTYEGSDGRMFTVEPPCYDSHRQAEAAEAIAWASVGLTPRSRFIVTRRAAGETLDEIATALCLPKEYIRQVQHKTEAFMRARLEKSGIFAADV